MMDNNQLFEDDFEVPGVQPSSAIPVLETPEQSQAAWYDLEDEDLSILSGDENEEDAGTLMKRQASLRTARQSSVRQTPSIPSSASGKWQQMFSLRTIALGIVIIGLISGVFFAAHGFFSPPTRAQNLSPSAMPQATKQPPRQSQATVLSTPMSTPATPGVVGTQNIPAAWTASGRGMADILEALSVAETFTQRYETIDFRSTATLNSSRFILTTAANQRFAAQDKRSTDAFANQVQQQQLVQTAIVTGAQLMQAQNQNGDFFAWVTVSYQQDVQQGQNTANTSSKTMAILLIAAPFNTPVDAPPMGGIGWLVSNYEAGNTPLAIPTVP